MKVCTECNNEILGEAFEDFGYWFCNEECLETWKRLQDYGSQVQLIYAGAV